MKRTGSGRVLATVFLGVMFGVYRHVDEIRWMQRGRDAYMAVQSQRFERITQYHSFVSMLVAGVIVATIAVGLYELIAAGFARMLPPSTVEE